MTAAPERPAVPRVFRTALEATSSHRSNTLVESPPHRRAGDGRVS